MTVPTRDIINATGKRAAKRKSSGRGWLLPVVPSLLEAGTISPSGGQQAHGKEEKKEEQTGHGTRRNL